MKGALAAAATLLLAASPPLHAQGEPTLDLQVVRWYRPAASATVFDVFFTVPYALLDPLTQAAGGLAAYRVAVSVKDSGGVELLTRSWSRTVPAESVLAVGASAGEHLTFGAPPGEGRYTIELTLTDSATGRVVRQRGEAVAYTGPPGASDLLLVRKRRPAPAYSLEVYREGAESVAVTAEVRSEAGEPVIESPSQRLPLDAGGAVTRDLPELSSLPPGTYRLTVVVRTADSTLHRDVVFRVAALDHPEAAAAAAPAPPRAPDLFDGVTDARLDTLYLPLLYLVAPDEQGLFNRLSVEGKRAYLRQFWVKRDPTPGTPRNEAQEDFYRRTAEANRRFREGGAGQIPGWRTDRGRIFIKYGPPDEVLSRPPSGSANPYEVWKYGRERIRKYVFLDLTRFGNYALIWTDDRREPSRPNWRELLGREAVEDVLRF
jgi:GWxTD domain-containing protein